MKSHLNLRLRNTSPVQLRTIVQRIAIGFIPSWSSPIEFHSFHMIREVERDGVESIFSGRFLGNHECQKILLSIFMNETLRRVVRAQLVFESERDGNSVRIGHEKMFH